MPRIIHFEDAMRLGGKSSEGCTAIGLFRFIRENLKLDDVRKSSGIAQALSNHKDSFVGIQDSVRHREVVWYPNSC